jgi:hypothetical protein
MADRVLTAAFCVVVLSITIALNNSILIRRLGPHSFEFFSIFFALSIVQLVLTPNLSQPYRYFAFALIPYISSFLANLIIAFLWIVDARNKTVTFGDAVIVSAWSPYFTTNIWMASLAVPMVTIVSRYVIQRYRSCRTNQ